MSKQELGAAEVGRGQAPWPAGPWAGGWILFCREWDLRGDDKILVGSRVAWVKLR